MPPDEASRYWLKCTDCAPLILVPDEGAPLMLVLDDGPASDTARELNVGGIGGGSDPGILF